MSLFDEAETMDDRQRGERKNRQECVKANGKIGEKKLRFFTGPLENSLLLNVFSKADLLS